VFSWDGLSLTLDYSESYGGSVQSVAWSPDGQHLAVGGGAPTSGDEIQVFSWDGLSLTLEDSENYGSAVRSVAWSSDGQYLAVGGREPANGNEIQIFNWNGLLLALDDFRDYGIAGSIVRSVAWLSDGQRLAAGGSGPINGNEIQVFEGTFSVRHLIESNKVCNTIGNATGVVGNSLQNVFIKNIGYQNDTNFSSGITNVFTDGLLYDPNLLDNISLPGTTTPAAPASSASCPGSSGTISDSGVYTVNGTDACCITIAADDVYLDLQGYTLTCTIAPAIQVNPSHKNIVIKNGAIEGNGTYDGIFTDTGCELITIENVNIYSCDNAITFSGALSSMIKSCDVKSCEFHECNKGVFATYIKKTVFQNCAAKNCIEAGFEQHYSDFNLYLKCKALEISNDDVAKVAISTCEPFLFPPIAR